MLIDHGGNNLKRPGKPGRFFGCVWPLTLADVGKEIVDFTLDMGCLTA